MGEKHDQLASELNFLNLPALLLALVFTLLIVPMFENWAGEGIILRAGVTIVVLLAAISTRRRRVVLLVFLFSAAFVIPLFWLTMLIQAKGLFIVGCLFDAGFLFAMAVYLLGLVLKKYLATAQAIYGAVCAYLLAGLAWAMVFWAIDTNDPTAIYFPGQVIVEGRSEVRAFSELVYFSFVTMSTLGYGDILPVSSIARTLAWMQSVTGMFYMAIVVAWIVSELPSREEALESLRLQSRSPGARGEEQRNDPAKRS